MKVDLDNSHFTIWVSQEQKQTSMLYISYFKHTSLSYRGEGVIYEW